MLENRKYSAARFYSKASLMHLNGVFFERVCKILKCPWNLKKSEFKKNKLFLSLCVLFLINALNFALLKLSIEK